MNQKEIHFPSPTQCPQNRAFPHLTHPLFNHNMTARGGKQVEFAGFRSGLMTTRYVNGSPEHDPLS